MNTSVGLVILLLAIVVSSSMTFASAATGSLVIKGFPQKSPLDSGEIPVIVGRVTDSAGKPVAGVSVTAVVGEDQASTVSGTDGSFKISLAPANSGKHYTNVIAAKDGFEEVSTIIVYNVKEPAFIPPDFTGVQTLVQDSLTNNPLSEYLVKQMDASRNLQEEEQKKLQEIEQSKVNIDEQRKLAKAELEKDLRAFNAESTLNSARKSFEAFVIDMDGYVRGIFLDQFGFTEQKTMAGKEAKTKALESGASSKEAMKAFQKKASSTRGDVISYNTYLNAKHGFAHPTLQNSFDSEGKLPRYNNDTLP
ncbi:MAG: carboxypeptidase regulatory-like domain-containing protein [Thaumarchaeota archaeon]|nr:carboxypeptidase regulatory-like domain-containing protein [Nitrososphaerota archaeon]